MDEDVVHTDFLAILARNLPEFEVRSISPLGARIDNAACEVNGELVVLQGKEPDVAARAEAVRREAALLAEVARLSPLPVLAPIVTDVAEPVRDPAVEAVRSGDARSTDMAPCGHVHDSRGPGGAGTQVSSVATAPLA